MRVAGIAKTLARKRPPILPERCGETRTGRNGWATGAKQISDRGDARGKSSRLHNTVERGELDSPGPAGGKGGAVRRDRLPGNMGGDMNPANLSTKRQWIAELARRKPGAVLYSLHHVIDLEWMQEAYALTRKDG